MITFRSVQTGLTHPFNCLTFGHSTLALSLGARVECPNVKNCVKKCVKKCENRIRITLFLEQLKRILEMPDSEAGIKVVKSGGVDWESVGPLSVEKESQGC